MIRKRVGTGGNKLKNKKCLFQGIVFDSKLEMHFYQHLLKEQSEGRILDIKLQPKLELQPKFERNGVKYRAITYTPDFWVKYADGTELYIDTKGQSTQAGELRRKLFAYKYETPLVWMAESKKYSETGFMDYDQLQKIRRENRKLKKAVG